MKKSNWLLLLLVCCYALVAPARAEKADRDKVINIDADRMRVDDVKQVNSFTGNVIMTKGTILVRAARIDVRQDPDGYQFGAITGAPDKPAFFRQKREALDEYIEVESERIDYDGRADVVKFMGKAVLRRLRGATLADEITGELIVYENLTDKFSVDGRASTGGAPVSGQRVHAMLTPKPDVAASAPQPHASAIPSKTTVQPGPALRATSTLGSSPQ